MSAVLRLNLLVLVASITFASTATATRTKVSSIVREVQAPLASLAFGPPTEHLAAFQRVLEILGEVDDGRLSQDLAPLIGPRRGTAFGYDHLLEIRRFLRGASPGDRSALADILLEFLADWSRYARGGDTLPLAVTLRVLTQLQLEWRPVRGTNLVAGIGLDGLYDRYLAATPREVAFETWVLRALARAGAMRQTGLIPRKFSDQAAVDGAAQLCRRDSGEQATRWCDLTVSLFWMHGRAARDLGGARDVVTAASPPYRALGIIGIAEAYATRPADLLGLTSTMIASQPPSGTFDAPQAAIWLARAVAFLEWKQPGSLRQAGEAVANAVSVLGGMAAVDRVARECRIPLHPNSVHGVAEVLFPIDERRQTSFKKRIRECFESRQVLRSQAGELGFTDGKRHEVRGIDLGNDHQFFELVAKALSEIGSQYATSELQFAAREIGSHLRNLLRLSTAPAIDDATRKVLVALLGDNEDTAAAASLARAWSGDRGRLDDPLVITVRVSLPSGTTVKATGSVAAELANVFRGVCQSPEPEGCVELVLPHRRVSLEYSAGGQTQQGVVDPGPTQTVLSIDARTIQPVTVIAEVEAAVGGGLDEACAETRRLSTGTREPRLSFVELLPSCGDAMVTDDATTSCANEAWTDGEVEACSDAMTTDDATLQCIRLHAPVDMIENCGEQHVADEGTLKCLVLGLKSRSSS